MLAYILCLTTVPSSEVSSIYYAASIPESYILWNHHYYYGASAILLRLLRLYFSEYSLLIPVTTTTTVGGLCLGSLPSVVCVVELFYRLFRWFLRGRLYSLVVACFGGFPASLLFCTLSSGRVTTRRCRAGYEEAVHLASRRRIRAQQ